MANDTKEEFWGCTLTKDKKEYVWDPYADSENDVEHKLQLSTACLGNKAKDSERNLVEVTTEDDSGKKITCPVVSLRAGGTECLHLDLGFHNTTKFTLKEGSGPLGLCGVHLQAFPLDFDEDESSDDEDIPDLVSAKQEDKKVKIADGPADILKSKKEAQKKTDTKVEEKKEDAKKASKKEESKKEDNKKENLAKRSAPQAVDKEELPAKKKKAEPVDEEESDDEDDEDDEDEEDDDEDEDESDEEMETNLVLKEAVEDDDEESDEDDDEPEEGDDVDSDEDEEDDEDEDMESDEEDEESDEEEEEEEKPAPKKKLTNGHQPTPVANKNKAQNKTPQPNKKTPGKKEQTPNKKTENTPKAGGPKKTPDEIKSMLLKSPNLPKKFDKFCNYMRNNMKVTDGKTQKDLWDYIQKNKK